MKHILFLLPIILTTSCASNPQESQCDPEKNYIISNPELMEKYKEEFKNGEVKSLYYDFSELPANKGKICKHSSCARYNNKIFDFTERKFNNLDRSGIYTIYSHEKNDKRCNFWSKNWDEICFESVKNYNNEIISKYGVFMYSENNASILELKNIKDDKIIYKYSSTIYMTSAIGGPGYGSCNVMKDNNPNYKFNVLGFPSNP